MGRRGFPRSSGRMTKSSLMVGCVSLVGECNCGMYLIGWKKCPSWSGQTVTLFGRKTYGI